MKLSINNQKWIVAVFFVVLVMACGKGNETASNSSGAHGGPGSGGTTGSVYGVWNLGAFDVGPMHVNVNLRVEDGKVTAQSDCSAEGQTVRASAVSAAEITASQIKIKEDRKDEQFLKLPSGRFRCNAHVTPGTVNYSVSGDKMTMTQDGSSEKRELTRVSGL